MAATHVAEDPRFATLEARQRNRPALLDVMRNDIAPAAKQLTLAEAAERFAAEDVPFARARRLTELHEDPQIAHNQVFSTIEHPTAGTLRHARPAPRFGRTPAAPGGPAPVAGQHTREILGELGLSATHRRLARARHRRGAADLTHDYTIEAVTMNFGFTEEQELLRDQVRRFMQDACPMQRGARADEERHRHLPFVVASGGRTRLARPRDSGALRRRRA